MISNRITNFGIKPFNWIQVATANFTFQVIPLRKIVSNYYQPCRYISLISFLFRFILLFSRPHRLPELQELIQKLFLICTWFLYLQLPYGTENGTVNTISQEMGLAGSQNIVYGFLITHNKRYCS